MARYYRRGTTKIAFVTALANRAAPDISSEIDAGTDLTAQLADISGFGVTEGTISTPDMADRFTKEIGGEQTAEHGSITFYEDDSSTALKAALARETTGFVVIMPEGKVAGQPADVFAVRVAKNDRTIEIGNEAAKFVVNFTITDEPTLDGTLAA